MGCYVSCRLFGVNQLVAPPKINQRIGCARVMQVLFQILLLDIDHGKKSIVWIERCFHAKHFLAAVNGVARVPRQTVFSDAMGHAHLLQNFHGAAREHDGARPL